MDPAESPQEAVARARATVMRGRGPGADKSETDRYKRERPTLGPLPAPLEREMVHLRTAEMLSGMARGVDPVSIRNQIDRVREVWSPKPPEHSRSVAVAHAIVEPAPGAVPDTPQPTQHDLRERQAHAGRPRADSRQRPQYALTAALGAVVGVAATITVQGCRNRLRARRGAASSAELGRVGCHRRRARSLRALATAERSGNGLDDRLHQPDGKCDHGLDEVQDRVQDASH
ncbi:MAG: hypothetical protein GEV09_13660 [Pseudonocardiaceae bacterium]|nr:hypothetical protein [Pseudonocardiaceae bacterium]